MEPSAPDRLEAYGWSAAPSCLARPPALAPPSSSSPPTSTSSCWSWASTATLVGSSGAGKSTLINRLIGHPVLRTGAVRESDDRGRHTTTHRELFLLPGGAMIIDNPGIRELQLWSAEEALDAAFDDIARLATACRFRDCRHVAEPGCAVRAAIDSGALDGGRLESLRALERETAALERRRDSRQARQAERRTGRLYKAIQTEKKRRRDDPAL
jgi:ribosome biogenesis GTPase / thiamine phosphate phosphatase